MNMPSILFQLICVSTISSDQKHSFSALMTISTISLPTLYRIFCIYHKMKCVCAIYRLPQDFGSKVWGAIEFTAVFPEARTRISPKLIPFHCNLSKDSISLTDCIYRSIDEGGKRGATREVGRDGYLCSSSSSWPYTIFRS